MICHLKHTLFSREALYWSRVLFTWKQIMSAASLGDQPKLSVAPSGGSGRDGLGMGSRLQAPPEDEEEDEGIQSDEEEVQLQTT